MSEGHSNVNKLTNRNALCNSSQLIGVSLYIASTSKYLEKIILSKTSEFWLELYDDLEH